MGAVGENLLPILGLPAGPVILLVLRQKPVVCNDLTGIIESSEGEGFSDGGRQTERPVNKVPG